MFSLKTLVSALSLALIASATAVPRQRPLAQVVSKCTVPNTVALTFDDGPWVYSYDVSKALVAAGAKGTFFVNGNNFQCIYDADQMKRIKYLHEHGHQLASHTWSHSHLPSLSWDQTHDEFWRVEQALERIIGVAPAFMRPPFGEYNDLVREVAAARGQKVIIWDFDSEDSIGASVAQSKSLYDGIVSSHPPTLLSLNHEVIETTVHQVLPYAIAKLQAAGYRLVTLAECLGEQPYQWTTAPGTPDASWTC